MTLQTHWFIGQRPTTWGTTMSPEASLMNVRDEMRAEINDLRKAIEIAELMFRRFKGKITGDEAAAMMRASIETTLRVRAQFSK